MARRTDATPPEQPPEDDTALDVAAAPGNVTDQQQVLLNDLAATQELVLKQEEVIQKLAAQVEKLSQSAESDPPVVEDQPGPPPLADGFRRYASRFAELTLIRVAGRRIYVDGVPIFEPQIAVDFSGGVYETDDLGTQEWLEQHPSFNTDFWLDEYAIRRHTTVEVVPGVKTTTVTPRVAQPLVAQMQ